MEARTAEKFAMAGWSVPFVSKVPRLYQIYGEVYAITPEQLAWCDSLEGHPNGYRREIVDIEAEGVGGGRAWIYLMDRPYETEWYASGVWPQP